MGPTEATSTLLVDKALRTEYEALEATILEAKTELITALKAQASTRKDVERTVSSAFTSDTESFFKALFRIENELATDTAEFADVLYDVVFDDKVVALLRTPDFRAALSDYVTRFNELLDTSIYFNRKTFNYYNAATVTKSLGDNGFFTAKHAVLLNAGDSSEQISTQKELTALIDAEKKKISDDEDLRKKFSELEKQLNRNVEARRFYEYIASHIELLPELENIDGFNEKVWTSYIKVNEPLYVKAVKLS